MAKRLFFCMACLLLLQLSLPAAAQSEAENENQIPSATIDFDELESGYFTKIYRDSALAESSSGASSESASSAAASSNTSSDEEEVVPLIDILLEQFDDDHDGALSSDEVADVTELDLKDRSLTDLDGIEQMTALTALDLSYNRLRDLTPLTALQNLRVLNLYENHNLISAEPLGELPLLEKLSITYDKKTGFPVLPALTYLYLSGTGQTAIDNLTPQPSLLSLVLVNSRARDFSILPSCYPNLEQLAFYHSEAVNTNQLTGFANLTELSFQMTEIRATEGLASMTGLISLELRETGITDLSILDPLQRLTILVVLEDGVADLSPLLNHPSLQSLTVESTGVEVLPRLRTLTGLTPQNTRFVLPKVSLQTARRMLPDSLTADNDWMLANFDTANSPVFYRISIICLGGGVILLLVGTLLAYRFRRKQKSPEPETDPGKEENDHV